MEVPYNFLLPWFEWLCYQLSFFWSILNTVSVYALNTRYRSRPWCLRRLSAMFLYFFFSLKSNLANILLLFVIIVLAHWAVWKCFLHISLELKAFYVLMCFSSKASTTRFCSNRVCCSVWCARCWRACRARSVQSNCLYSVVKLWQIVSLDHGSTALRWRPSQTRFGWWKSNPGLSRPESCVTYLPANS